jgi:hypothetical protein
MSIDMDVGPGVPGAGSAPTNIEAKSTAIQAGWQEGLLMVVATTAGVLAASSLAVWVYLG